MLPKSHDISDVHILCIATESIFTESITAFINYFKSKGLTVSYECAFNKARVMPFSNKINLVIKAQRKFTPDLLPKESLKILFQTEQFDKLRKFESMPHSENWDLILDVFQNNIEKVKNTTSTAIRFFPIGYDLAYQSKQFTVPTSEKYFSLDCYFFGARTKHRTQFWQENVVPVAPNSRFGNSDYNDDKCFNITHAKINLFIPAWEPYLLPTMHTMQILANNGFLLVVSDTPQNFHPYQSGSHFALTDSKSASGMIERFLDDSFFRERFTNKMFRNIADNHTFTHYADHALEDFI